MVACVLILGEVCWNTHGACCSPNLLYNNNNRRKKCKSKEKGGGKKEAVTCNKTRWLSKNLAIIEKTVQHMNLLDVLRPGKF